MFAKEIYIARRDRLAQAMRSGLLLFLGNEASAFNYADNAYPFRQDSTFLYLFGLDSEGLAAAIDADTGRAVVFGDDLTLDDVIWTGPMPSLAERAAAVGVAETQPRARLAEYVEAARRRGQAVHFVPPYRADRALLLRDLLGPDAQPSLDLIYALADMRNRKGPEEVAQIEQAVAISVRMHRAAIAAARPGATERDVAAAVMQVALREGYFYSFPPICTTRGETLHNHGYVHTLRAGDLLLLDAGAEGLMHYAGDLTTTMPVGDAFTPRQRDVYDVLLHAYRTACAQLRPGVSYRDCHVRAWAAIAEGLVQLGLMQGDPAEAAEAGAVALFMPHGLGHMMGLDVHDMESYGEQHVGYARGQHKDTRFGFASLRLGRTLEPGFVHTVEPGIYFIPALIDRWRAERRFADFIRYDRLDAWRDFGGMRNEEDWLITPDGARRLGPAKPTTPDDFAACRG